MHNPKFLNPRFYVKSVGGQLTIVHRLTHSYVISVETEEDLTEEIKRLNSLTEEVLWRYLLFQVKVRLPNAQTSVISKVTNEHEHDEEWFRGAWSVYTDLFYTRNPKLLVVEEQLPMGIINKLRKEIYAQGKLEDDKRRDELREGERLAKLDEQSVKKLIRKKEKNEPEATGRLGNPASLERMGNKKKKIIKRLKIKAPNNSVFEILDTDDPFA